MKKVIVAIDNKKILNKIKKTNNLKINFKRVQYREAILEILKKEKNIDIILMDEKLSGEISIENLINKIKKINKRISIIFFLRKKDLEKENKLRKLKIEKIYFINQINLNKISNLLNKNKETKISSISTLASSPEFNFQSEAQVLMEPTTGKILYANNENEKLLPASVTKVMTMLLTMEQIDSRKNELSR